MALVFKSPNLLQYVSTGVYFARVKVQGKLIRRSLDTNVFTTAKLKLNDFKKKHSEPEPEMGTVGAALKKYLRQLNTAHDKRKTPRGIAGHVFALCWKRGTGFARFAPIRSRSRLAGIGQRGS